MQVEAKCLKRSTQNVPYFDSYFACFNKITAVVCSLLRKWYSYSTTFYTFNAPHISLSLALSVCVQTVKYIVLQVWFHIYWTWSIYIVCKFVYYVQQYQKIVCKLGIIDIYSLRRWCAIMILRCILSLFRSSFTHSQRCVQMNECYQRSHALWILLRAFWPLLRHPIKC